MYGYKPTRTGMTPVQKILLVIMILIALALAGLLVKMVLDLVAGRPVLGIVPQSPVSPPSPVDTPAPSVTPTPTIDPGGERYEDQDDATSTPTPEFEGLSPSCMPGAIFDADLSVPDGTAFSPGEEFTKEWRIRSNGCAPWPAGTRLVFDSGERMDGPDSVPVPETELDGTADVAVDLEAPDEAGTYTGYWQMAAPDGTRFGERIYVMITVR